MSRPMNTAVDQSAPYAPPFVVAESLDDLRGPSADEVVLPNRLLWNPSRPFDLTDEKRLRSMMSIVLREARTQDDLSQYLSRENVIRLWGALGLPTYIQRAWEEKFPELTNGGAQWPAVSSCSGCGMSSVTSSPRKDSPLA